MFKCELAVVNVFEILAKNIPATQPTGVRTWEVPGRLGVSELRQTCRRANAIYRNHFREIRAAVPPIRTPMVFMISPTFGNRVFKTVYDPLQRIGMMCSYERHGFIYEVYVATLLYKGTTTTVHYPGDFPDKVPDKRSRLGMESVPCNVEKRWELFEIAYHFLNDV